MKKLVKLIALALCFCMMFSVGVYADDDTPMLIATYKGTESVTGTVTEVQKYGNIVMDFEPAALADAGYNVGDILTVKSGENELEIPLCTSYSDVDTGSLVIRLTDTQVIVAINMGNFSSTYGVVEGDTVTFELKEAEGYLAEYTVRQLTRTNERADYI